MKPEPQTFIQGRLNNPWHEPPSPKGATDITVKSVGPVIRAIPPAPRAA